MSTGNEILRPRIRPLLEANRFQKKSAFLEGYRVAFSGDSLMDPLGNASTWYPSQPVYAVAYSNGALESVPPAARAKAAIAIGGSTAATFISGSQLGEIEVQKAKIDVAIVQLGTNDMSAGVRTITQYISDMTTIRDAIVADGISKVVFSPPIPTQHAENPVAYDTVGTSWGGDRAAGVVNAVAALHGLSTSRAIVNNMMADFSDPAHPGRENRVFGKSNDGVHPHITAYAQAGKRIARLFKVGRLITIEPAARHTIVNTNPYNQDRVAAAEDWIGAYNPPAYLGVTSSRPDRTGGETGERWFDLTMVPTHTYIPYYNKNNATFVSSDAVADDSIVKFTPKNGAKVYVCVAYQGAATYVTPVVNNYRDGYLVVIKMGQSGGVNVKTASEIAAAVNADQLASEIVEATTPTGGGAGYGTAYYGATQLPTTVQNFTGTPRPADVSAPISGDYIRAAVELWKHPEHAWPPIFNHTLGLYADATKVAELLVLPAYAPVGLPEPTNGRMLLTTPWIPYSSGEKHNARLSIDILGTIRIARLMVQKSANPWA